MCTAYLTDEYRIRKMIIITFGPISCFHYHNTYWADYLTQAKIDFKIYDVYPMLKAKYNISASDVPDPINDAESANIEIMSTHSDFKVALKKLNKNDTFVVIFPEYEYITYRIYREISRYGLRYCVYNANGWISPRKIHNPQYSELFRSFHINTLIKALLECKSLKDCLLVCADVFPHLPKSVLGINSADYILQAGTDSLDYNFRFPIDKHTKDIWGHYRDYDLYLNGLKNEITAKKKQVVYVSTNLFHDVVAEKIPRWNEIMKPELYYDSLKKLFYILEEKGYSIIVAAHPREPISELKKYLPKWSITLGNTEQLIRESEFSIQLASHATRLSLLHNKPFIMITSDAIVETKESYGDGLSLTAQKYGKKLLNIDHMEERIAFEDYLYADQTLIDEFISEVVKAPWSPKIPLCQILLNSINSNNTLDPPLSLENRN